MMTVSGFGKDEILRPLAWRPIAVAAMATVIGGKYALPGYSGLIKWLDNSSPRSLMPPILSLSLSMPCDDFDGCVTIAELGAGYAEYACQIRHIGILVKLWPGYAVSACRIWRIGLQSS
ncbi:hypothetical protein Tco_0486848 [Tanacetum coccineum]